MSPLGMNHGFRLLSILGVAWGLAIACSTSSDDASCVPAECQQQCVAAGQRSGTCQGDSCVCMGAGGSGGESAEGGAGGQSVDAGNDAASDAGDGGDVDAACSNPACGLTDCDPANCLAPCSTECVSTAEHCEEDEWIYLCCIKSCNNGSETCDDERFIVPDATVDPDGIFYLVCADDGLGRVFLSVVSGNCDGTTIDRCRCYLDPPANAIDNAFEDFSCTAVGERFPVDLSGYRGQELYVGATTNPDGSGMNTRVCLQGN